MRIVDAKRGPVQDEQESPFGADSGVMMATTSTGGTTTGAASIRGGGEGAALAAQPDPTKTVASDIPSNASRNPMRSF